MMTDLDQHLADGEKWLTQATGTYEGGGGAQSATAEATIAVGYYLRALLDALGEAAEDDRVNAAIAGEVAESKRRHPAGTQRAVRLSGTILGIPRHHFASGPSGGEICAVRVDGAPCGQHQSSPIHGTTNQ